MYDVGIVGCGVIGNRLAESFAEHERTNVWGACDLVESKVEAFAEEYDCETFTDYLDLVDQCAIDVVYVGVPPANHHEIVSYALEADTHVICEKPIAEDAERGQELVELAADSDQVTAINLPFRYTSGFVEMRERIDSGEIGDPKRVELKFRFPQWPRDWQDVDWLAGREQGGPLREVGTHFLFGVQEIFGPIERVSAEVAYSGPDKYEDSIVGYFEVEAIYGTIDLVTDHDEQEENSITVLGSDSQLSLRKWYELVEGSGDDERVVHDTRESTTLALVDEFVSSLDGGEGDLVTFEEANRVQRVVDAIFDSEGVERPLEG
ncbi:Gfo/Idh/MocA family protein [Halorussus halophilus]|uniref:Gfo/Idh/MocA family protein n=1 Tax=Halorussus halophilus TaxID=2650975 RepID=UPI0013012215|nr:Gfo/Idh/MocA family oxidoreductase [Halorussus halophilus]